MAKVRFTKEMFRSKESLNLNVPEANILASKQRKWAGYLQFIAFCIGRRSAMSISIRYQENISAIQDFMVILLLGIPICYLQLVLGNFAGGGVFLIRRMLPIAEGIVYVSMIIVFLQTVFIACEMETHLLYLILSMVQSTPVWNLCREDFKDICWDYKTTCTEEKPCIDENKRLPSYLFWNYTYMGGAYPKEKAALGIPDYRPIFLGLTCWLGIYCLTIIPFQKFKRTIQILVAISMMSKVFILAQYIFSIGYEDTILPFLVPGTDTWFDIKTWGASVQRVCGYMMLSDFTYFIYGMYAKKDSSLETMSAICALTCFGVLMLELAIMRSAVQVLVEYSKINSEDSNLLFMRHSPSVLVIIPASFGVMGRPNVMLIFYFTTNIITYFTRAVINLVFIQLSFYQRFQHMESYHKYICSSICMFGFAIGIFMQTKEIHEARFDFQTLSELFCQHINLLALMLVIVFVYGFMQVGDDIQFMTGKQPSFFWKSTWLISPIILVMAIPLEFLDSGDQFYTFRMCSIFFLFSPILGYASYILIKRIYHRDVIRVLKPDALWGPPNETERRIRKSFHPRKQTNFMKNQGKCAHECLLNNQRYQSVVAAEDFYDRQTLGVLPRLKRKAPKPPSESHIPKSELKYADID